MQAALFPLTLVDSFMITATIKHFLFRCDLSAPFTYLPGQFITVHFDHEGTRLRRSYSIANAPQKDNRIEFAASYYEGGPGSELLFNLRPGDTLSVNGPFGRLTLKEELPSRYILVATSTGITPFRSMLQELSLRLTRNPNLEIVVLQGVQKKEDILYGDEFRTFIQNHPRTQFRAYLSREQKNNLGANEFPGYVQTAFPSLSLNPQQDVVYLCGNPGMIDNAFDDLKDRGFAVQQIIREKYISN